jgi:hypothetical protein
MTSAPVQADQARGRGDRDQAGHRAGRRAQHRRLALADPLHGPRHHRRGGGQEGVDEGDRRDAAGFQRRTGVEAEPAHPQDRRADHGLGQVVRLDRLAAVAGALADHVGTDQAGDRGIDVHHGAAGEVQRALGPQVARLGQHAIHRSVLVNASGPGKNQTMCAIGR